MTFKKKLTDAQERRIVVDFMDGIPIIELLDRYDVSRSTIERILADYNAPKSKNQGKRPGKRSDLRKRSPRQLKPCGTNAAYQRHIRKKEMPCLPCVDAHAEDQANRDRKKRDGSMAPAGYATHIERAGPFGDGSFKISAEISLTKDMDKLKNQVEFYGCGRGLKSYTNEFGILVIEEMHLSYIYMKLKP